MAKGCGLDEVFSTSSAILSQGPRIHFTFTFLHLKVHIFMRLYVHNYRSSCRPFVPRIIISAAEGCFFVGIKVRLRIRSKWLEIQNDWKRSMNKGDSRYHYHLRPFDNSNVRHSDAATIYRPARTLLSLWPEVFDPPLYRGVPRVLRTHPNL